jgi:hypothetical protein
MDINERFRKSKKLIFTGWIIMVAWDLFLEALEYFNLVNYPQNIPAMIGYILAAIVMWYGLWLGSRGIGIPLSISVFLNLLFGYPYWIPFSALLLLNVVIPTLFW